MPPDPLILGFDTSAAHCAAALLSDDRIVARAFAPMARGQVEHLMPLLEDVLGSGGADWGDLSALGVGIGPGNFTGIRISVSAARGLALSLGIPAVGVSTLEAAAFGKVRPVTVRRDARRSMVYQQDFLPRGDTTPELVPADQPAAHPLADLSDDALAEAIARIAATRWQDRPTPPAPLYLRAADAAPDRASRHTG